MGAGNCRVFAGKTGIPRSATDSLVKSNRKREWEARQPQGQYPILTLGFSQNWGHEIIWE